jgi:putative addiction module killer protein
MVEVRKTDSFEKWLRALDERVRAKVNIRVRRLSQGNYGDVKPVGEGISELRIDYGPGYRVYLKRTGTEIVLLLCGGDKRTQSKDILLAKKLADGM